MAVVADKVIVELEAKLARYNAEIDRSRARFDRHMEGMTRSGQRMEANLRQSFGRTAASLRSLAVAAGGGLGARQVTAYADAWTRTRARLTAAGVETDRLTAKQGELFDIAQRSRASFEDVVQLYSRMAIAANELGTSEHDLTKLTETLSKAMQLGGATTSEASAALLQFSQAIGSGVLQGDELRSIRENAPLVAQAIAKEFGVAVGGLKKLGEEGQLTSDRVLKAILKVGPEIEREFGKLPGTVGSSFQQLENAIVAYIGLLDQATGASQTLTQGIGGLAENIDSVTNGLDYARGAFDLVTEKMASFTNLLGDMFGDSDMLAKTKSELNAVIGAFNAAYGAIEGIWNNLPALMGEIAVDAGNRLIAAIEAAINAMAGAINNFVSQANNILKSIGSHIPGLEYLGSKLPTIPPIPNVSLGRIANDNRGSVANIEGIVKDAMSRDYIGEVDAEIRKRAAVHRQDRESAERFIFLANQQGGGQQSTATRSSPLAPVGTGGGRGRGRRSGTGGGANEFGREVQQIRERTEALLKEAEAVGKGTYEVERSRAALELEQAAKQAGLEITPALRKEIDGLAGAYANAAQQVENAEELQRAFDELRDIGRDAFKGLAEAMEDGKIKGSELREILRDLQSKLLDLATNTIFDSLFGKQGQQGGGILGSLFSGLFGGAGGGLGSIFGFASGTANTGGMRGQPRGIVHGQEAVIPLPNSGRIPIELPRGFRSQPIEVQIGGPTFVFDGKPDEKTMAAFQRRLDESNAALKRDIGRQIGAVNTKWASLTG